MFIIYYMYHRLDTIYYIPYTHVLAELARSVLASGSASVLMSLRKPKGRGCHIEARIYWLFRVPALVLALLSLTIAVIYY